MPSCSRPARLSHAVHPATIAEREMFPSSDECLGRTISAWLPIVPFDAAFVLINPLGLALGARSKLAIRK